MAKSMSAKAYYLGRRGAGSSVKLVGDVISIVFFVNDKTSRWTESAKQKYLNEHNSALIELENQAKAKKVNLRFRVASCELDVDCDCSIHNSSDSEKALIKALRSKSVADYKAFYKGRHPCDEVPLMFAFNKEGRGFASIADLKNPLKNEYSVMFSHSGNFYKRSIMHELLHQFGGVDYYYPQTIRTYAEKYLPDSIMNIGYESQNKVDSFTSYLIGWSNTVNSNTIKFLDLIKDVTYDDIIYARRQTIKND